MPRLPDKRETYRVRSSRYKSRLKRKGNINTFDFDKKDLATITVHDLKYMPLYNHNPLLNYSEMLVVTAAHLAFKKVTKRRSKKRAKQTDR